MEEVETLQKIGLNEKEARVYLALLELGTAAVQSIASKADLKRPTTYLILDELRQKGMVSIIPRAKKALYTAESPEKLIGDLRKKEELLKLFLPNLLALYNAKKEKPQVQLFDGKEGVKLVYEKIYASAEMWFFGDIKDVQSVYMEGFEQFLKMIRQRNVVVRELLIKSSINLTYAERAKGAKTTEIRFLKNPTKFLVTDIGLFDDNVVFFSFRPQIFAVVIKSKEISGNLKTLYEIAWQAAEPYEKVLTRVEKKL